MSLTRDKILEANDRAQEVVSVPEWGGEVIVSAMSGTARDAWEQSLVGAGNKPDLSNLRARLAAFCMVDEQGARLFSDADLEVLGGKSAIVLDRVARTAQRLNKMSDVELEEAKGN